MSWKTVVCCLGLAAVVAAAPALGDDTAMPRVEKRQDLQQQRIGQGAASGQLTPRETIRLEREQAGIERAQKRAEADGSVTPAERARLNKRQNKASRRIYRQKHDVQTAK